MNDSEKRLYQKACEKISMDQIQLLMSEKKEQLEILQKEYMKKSILDTLEDLKIEKILQKQELNEIYVG